VTFGYNPAGSYSEQMEYLLHDEAHCRALCARHPGVTTYDVEDRRERMWPATTPSGRHSKHFLITIPGTQTEFSVKQGPCWNCRIGPRRWLRRPHWNCRIAPYLDTKLKEANNG
jgi:hypothetical protein